MEYVYYVLKRKQRKLTPNWLLCQPVVTCKISMDSASKYLQSETVFLICFFFSFFLLFYIILVEMHISPGKGGGGSYAQDNTQLWIVIRIQQQIRKLLLDHDRIATGSLPNNDIYFSRMYFRKLCRTVNSYLLTFPVIRQTRRFHIRFVSWLFPSVWEWKKQKIK